MKNVCFIITMPRMASSHPTTHTSLPVHSKQVQPFPRGSHTSCVTKFSSTPFRGLPDVLRSALLHFLQTSSKVFLQQTSLFRDNSYYGVKRKILQFIPWVHSQIILWIFQCFITTTFFHQSTITLIMHLNSISLTLNLLQCAVIKIFDLLFII